MAAAWQGTRYGRKRYRSMLVTRNDTPTQSTILRHLPFFQTTHVYDEKVSNSTSVV